MCGGALPLIQLSKVKCKKKKKKGTILISKDKKNVDFFDFVIEVSRENQPTLVYYILIVWKIS